MEICNSVKTHCNLKKSFNIWLKQNNHLFNHKLIKTGRNNWRYDGIIPIIEIIVNDICVMVTARFYGYKFYDIIISFDCYVIKSGTEYHDPTLINPILCEKPDEVMENEFNSFLEWSNKTIIDENLLLLGGKTNSFYYAEIKRSDQIKPDFINENFVALLKLKKI